MRKVTLLIILSFAFIGCVNEKKEYIERLNKSIGTDFNYKDERIIIEQEQDFSSLITSITINLTPIERQQVLNKNKHLFRYYETKVDCLMLKGFSYDIEYDHIRESINIKKDSNILNYTIFQD